MKILLLATDTKYVEFYEKVIRETCPGSRLYLCGTVGDAGEMIPRGVDFILADLLLSDHGKQRFDGIEFLNWVRRSLGYLLVPIVVVTDLWDANDHLCKEIRCYSYFQKPLNKALFIEQIVPVLREAEYRSLRSDVHLLHFFKKNGDFYVVKDEDLIWYKSKTHEGSIRVGEKELDVDVQSIRNSETLEHSDRFIRCDRGVFVNIDYVLKVGKDKVVLSEDMGVLDISDSGRRNLLDRMDEIRHSESDGNLES